MFYSQQHSKNPPHTHTQLKNIAFYLVSYFMGENLYTNSAQSKSAHPKVIIIGVLKHALTRNQSSKRVKLLHKYKYSRIMSCG